MLEWGIVLGFGCFLWIVYARHLRNVEKKREELRQKEAKEAAKLLKRPNALQRRKMEKEAKNRSSFQSDGKVYLHGRN